MSHGERPEGPCGTCNDRGEVLHFYERPGSPPGNQMVPCPACKRGLNPGIEKVVRILNDAGHQTCDSGDGKTHTFECDRDHGYVVIQSSRARLTDESHEVAALLQKWGMRVLPVGFSAEGEAVERPEPGVCWIEASYDPMNEVAVISVNHITDEMLGAGVEVGGGSSGPAFGFGEFGPPRHG